MSSGDTCASDVQHLSSLGLCMSSDNRCRTASDQPLPCAHERRGGAPATSALEPAASSRFDHAVCGAQTWLQRAIALSGPDSETAALARSCLYYMERLPADTRMESFTDLTTTTVFRLLGSHWLGTDQIMAGLDCISRSLGPSGRTGFINTYHLDSLRTYRASAEGPYNPRHPRFGDMPISSGAWARVVIPAFINTNHWTVFIIDCLQCTICYLDPLSPGREPKDDMLADLRWWLQSLIPGKSWTLAHYPSPPHQRDGDSCGVVLLSAVAAHLLQYSQWTQETWREHRMQWFLWICRVWFEDDVVWRCCCVLLTAADVSADTAP